MYPYINLFGLSIPSYGLMMALAFIAAILIAYYRTSKAGLDTDALLTLAIITLTCGLAGSYLLYIFVTYSLSEIWGSIVDGSFSVFKSGGLFIGEPSSLRPRMVARSNRKPSMR